jgi:myo-inositol-1-phosphate synthase
MVLPLSALFVILAHAPASDQSKLEASPFLCTDNIDFEDCDASTLVNKFVYRQNVIEQAAEGAFRVRKKETELLFKTEKTVPKTGVMIVGLGGNNGATLYGAIEANKNGISWMTKDGEQKPNYFGSVTHASTIPIGVTPEHKQIYMPMNKIVPMLHANDMIVGGWDINNANLAQAMERAKVFDFDLQKQLWPEMEKVTPLPGLYYPDFIAANQKERANNVIDGDKASNAHVEIIRKNIIDFKNKHSLDKVIVLWSANTERFAEVEEGLNMTQDELLASIEKEDVRVAPSTVYAVAAIMENCAFINGSPQNTFVPGLKELAELKGVFIGGSDFKSGQTKMKSVIAEFLVQAGLKIEAIASYNHLGNNDGRNLSSEQQFKSKEISKRGVTDDMVESNSILYAEGEKPDHLVVIKYLPKVGDSKRALDEYTSRIFMNGENTIVMHNTCEDSLLATPLIIDLVVLTELFQRITVSADAGENFQKFDSVLSVLSYLLKAPMVEKNAPVINALAAQRRCIVNILKALRGLEPDTDMGLEYKLKF